MEKASGELSLTVVTILAIAALAALVALVAPNIGNWIQDTFGNITGTEINMTDRN